MTAITRKKRKTVGKVVHELRQDTTKYDPLEIGHAVHDDLEKQLRKCIETHNKIFDEDEYCIGFVLAGDPLIKNVVRKKFFAMLYLPSPRPNQAVWLYNKRLDVVTKRLWVLPNALSMARLSEMPFVSPEYATMKRWSDAFYGGKFWETIRKDHDITMLSEVEYLKANHEELVKAGCKEGGPRDPKPFDFFNIHINEIADTQVALSD